MKIKLDEKHTLNSDQYCYWVYESRISEKGEPYDNRVSGYYRSLGQVIKNYIEKNIQSSEVEELKRLSQQIEDLKAEVTSWNLKDLKVN